MGGSFLNRIGWGSAGDEGDEEFADDLEYQVGDEDYLPSPTVSPFASRGSRGGTLTTISSVKSEEFSRIRTVRPRSFRDVQSIGEPFREGIPVIVNLSELDGPEVRRIVDFLSGLTFALKGKPEKITNRVILLSPASIKVEVGSNEAGSDPF